MAFKNTGLTADGLVGFLVGFAVKPEGKGIEVSAVKNEDLSGVLLVIRLLPGTQNNSESKCVTSERVIVSGKSIYGSGGGGTPEAYSDPKQWKDFSNAVTKALATGAETPFEISVRIAYRE